jgi:hypothetical protein
MSGKIGRVGVRAITAAAALSIVMMGQRPPVTFAQSADSSSTTIQDQALPPPPNTDESKVLGTAGTGGTSVAVPVAPPAPEAPSATTTSVPASSDWLRKGQAQLTVLDKIYGSASTISATVGTPFTVRFLTVIVLACWVRPPNLPPDAAVFLQVTDSHAAAGSPPEFRGWILHAEPALSGMADPATDISVTGCT